MTGKPAFGGAEGPAGPPRPCPVCRRPAAADFAPFCSRRCRDVDLLRWLDGRYRIPDPRPPDAGDED